MMHRPWSSIVEVPYCFSRSNVKFQGHTALKIVKFYRNWAFLDSNSSLNSLMVMKCCTKLETAKERCHIVFQSHPSNFKVTRDKTSPLLTWIGRFRTIGRSQLSNPSDLPCFSRHAQSKIIKLRIINPFWGGYPRWPVDYPQKWTVTQNEFTCHDVMEMYTFTDVFAIFFCTFVMNYVVINNNNKCYGKHINECNTKIEII